MRKSDQLRRQVAFQAAKAKSGPDHVARIDALTRNARSTWFGLLAVLVFMVVTLAGVEHIDFYGVNRATQLPLVNVSVPTRLFFLAAPLLTAAIYIYFHLYLIRLFDALGAAPAWVGKEPLSQVIAPWLINDAVLWERSRKRQDGCHPPRLMDRLSCVVNLVLVWGFGLGVLIYSWWVALPARSYLINGSGALLISLALAFATASTVALREATTSISKTYTSRLRVCCGKWGTSGFAVVCILISLSFANPHYPYLVQLNLIGQEIVGKPADWLPYQIARRDFQDEWRKREGLEKKEWDERQREQFDYEWRLRRSLAINDLARPAFNGRGVEIRLTDAWLQRAFLSGLKLSDARMDGAVLRRAQLEEANLSRAQMSNADLRWALLQRANLKNANLQNADFRSTQMERANFIGAQMSEIKLDEAQLEGANLSFSKLAGQPKDPVTLESTNLRASTNNGGALRFADLNQIEFDADTDFRNAFMDGSVEMSPEFEMQLGDQCQNLDRPTQDDAEFFGFWRGWIEHESSPNQDIWKHIAPPEFADVTPIPPPAGCVWKTGPMPD